MEVITNILIYIKEKKIFIQALLFDFIEKPFKRKKYLRIFFNCYI